MKKVVFTLLVLLSITLCGCSVLQQIAVIDSGVQTLKSWSFQSNSGTDDYSVFFALFNKNGKAVSASATVEIRIVNDSDEEVYRGCKKITESDFGYYTSKSEGEQFLADVRIKASEIKPGKTSSGTVYITIYNDNEFRFDEVNCRASFSLPIADVTVVSDQLPIEIDCKGYDGKLEAKIRVEEVAYTFDKGLLQQLNIEFSGTKTYGKTSTTYDIITYKLYDSGGYVVDTGNIYLRSLGQDDRFKDDSIVFYDVTPGETYTIRFFEYSR